MARQRLWWLGALIFVGLVIVISSFRTMDFPRSCSMGRIAWVNDSSIARAYFRSGRELLIGAYDLNNRRAGFQVGLLLILVAASIVDTAYIAQKYGQERLRETLGHLLVPSLGWILLVSVQATPKCSQNNYGSNEE